MQFPVPQYTEVEDRIIGNITVKQFFILLVAGGVVFFSYSLTKDYYVTGAAGVLVGIPSILVAFLPFNGRPMYFSTTAFLNYWTRPKLYVFQKQSMTSKVVSVDNLQKPKDKAVGEIEDPRSKLKRIQYQLEERAKQEEEALRK
jgi:hypothetical protein